VGFAKALPRWKNWLVDEPVAFPSNPAALGDIFASLAGPAAPLLYDRGDWPAPACKPFEAPAAPYAVLHVGARSPLRHWDPARWSMLAAELSRRGMQIALTAGPGEAALIDAIDPGHRYVGYPGSLDLAQLWHLIAAAKAVVTLDTGVAHLAKLTGTPTACIFGPGSAPLLGRGRFWSEAPFTEVTVADFPCRDQPTLFKRHVAWVRHCSRGREECSRARCMEAIEVSDVLAALGR
jgi:ADP-heptose:LPS heptosyltransferase